MSSLESRIRDLKDSEVQEKVSKRINEFERIGNKSDERWFSELSFCVLTANSSAQLGIDIQEELGSEGFIELSPSELQDKLEELGHRFYRTRAEYIVENREFSDRIKEIITGYSYSREAREWLVENVMGIGYKEGSHFLRNVGYENVMIVDRHILRILCDECVIDEEPNTLTKKRYLNIEERVEELAERTDISLAEIDLYLWYLETGKILK